MGEGKNPSPVTIKAGGNYGKSEENTRTAKANTT